VIDRRLVGLLALAIVVPGASITRSDFRAGIARFWASGGVIPFRAERAHNPTYFWAFTVINCILIIVIAAASMLMLVLP
jgi:hypothetical protein